MIVSVVGFLGLAVALVLFRQEPVRSVRVGALVGAGAGFALALVLSLAVIGSTVESLAVALLGGAVLPLVLLGQMRVVRMLTGGR
jgi:hypothetical protein